MSRMALLGAAVAATVAALAPPAFARGPIRVKTSISPGWAYFADDVTARVDVVVDRSRIDAGSIEVATTFTPWETVGATHTTTARTAAVARETVSYTLRCVVFACLPHGTVVQRFHLPVVTVTARTTDGASVVLKTPWPPVNVAGRFLPPSIGAVRPQLLLETQAPPARYAVPPSAAALAFDLLAAAAGLAAIGLALLEARRYLERRRHPVDERPPLVRALDLVREAQTRDAADRRRAAALVARLLPPPDEERSTAAAIAWSQPDPSPDDLGELAESVEARIDGR